MALARRSVGLLALAFLAAPVVLGGFLDDISGEEISSFVLKPGAVLGGIKFIEPHRGFAPKSADAFLSIEETGGGKGGVRLPHLDQRFIPRSGESPPPSTFGMAPRFPVREVKKLETLPQKKPHRLPELHIKQLLPQPGRKRLVSDIREKNPVFLPTPPEKKLAGMNPRAKHYGLGGSGILEIRGHGVGVGVQNPLDRPDPLLQKKVEEFDDNSEAGTLSHLRGHMEDEFDGGDTYDFEDPDEILEEDHSSRDLIEEQLPGVTPEKELGAGSFGSVWKAQLPNGLFCAIKVLLNVNEKEWPSTNWSECEVPKAIASSGSPAAAYAMKCMESRFIPMPGADVDEEGTGLFVLEYVGGETLGELLTGFRDSETFMDLDRVKKITKEIMSVVHLLGQEGINIVGKPGAMEPPAGAETERDAAGIETDVFDSSYSDVRESERYQDEEVKKRQVTHHDLKPDNIMIDADGNVKIIDFGASGECTPYSRTHDPLLATPLYMDPLTTGWDNAASSISFVEWQGPCWTYDEWASGAMLFEMLSNEYFVLKGTISMFGRPKVLNEHSENIFESQFDLNRRFKEVDRNARKKPFEDYVAVLEKMISMDLEERKPPRNIMKMLGEI